MSRIACRGARRPVVVSSRSSSSRDRGRAIGGALSALLLLVALDGCSRRGASTGVYVSATTGGTTLPGLGPVTVMFPEQQAPEVVRGAIARALEARRFQTESEEGTRVYARLTHRRGSIQIAIDYSATQAVMTPILVDGVDEREWSGWSRNLTRSLEEEVARPAREAAQARAQAEQQARDERLERERHATAQAQARAREAEAAATARESARLESQRRAQEARDARAQAREDARLAREARREEARLAREARRAGLSGSAQVIVVAPAPAQQGVVVAQQQPQYAPQQPAPQLHLDSGRANFGVHRVAGNRLAETYRVSVRSGGNVDARMAGLPASCRGAITSTPDVIVRYAQPTNRLAFWVDGAGDTTLIVRAPNQDWWCSDDEGGGVNPLIDISNPLAGQYEIWIGSYDAREQIQGTLQVYDPNQQQAQQAAVEEAPNCRALAMEAGYPAYASSCEGAEPYCAAAAIRSGNPAYISSCRGIDRPACAVAAAETGNPAYISSCVGVDSECAVAAFQAGYPAYVSSCAGVEPQCAVAAIRAGNPAYISSCRR
jgi:hypothetical protein